MTKKDDDTPKSRTSESYEDVKLNRRKAIAWYLFVYEKKMARDISLETGIPLGSIQRWQSLGAWTEARKNPMLPKPDMTTELSSLCLNGYVGEAQGGQGVVPTDIVPRVGFNSLGSIKAIEKWRSQAVYHENSYVVMRQYAESQFITLMNRTQRLLQESDPEESEQDAMNLTLAKSAGEWAKIVDICVKGERQITSAQYADLNQATLLLEQYGFNVTPKPAPKSSDSEVSGELRGVSPDTARSVASDILGVEI